MQDLGWKESIIEVLQEAAEPLHYTEITDRIVERELKTEFGATPAKSVSATITMSMKEDGEESPFVRVGRGIYALRSALVSELEATPVSLGGQAVAVAEQEAEPDEMGLINAFGMYWKRDAVLWAATPKILGQQQLGASVVDFSGQRGVYLLHDSRNVIYVGRTTDQSLGRRLFQHTADRLNGRWDRFSWFGVYAVTQEGSLQPDGASSFSLDNLIVTMEALLIEGLEPPQNRRQGDGFRAIEFLQVVDPEIQKSRIRSLMDELKAKL
jgi:hypothetical protein